MVLVIYTVYGFCCLSRCSVIQCLIVFKMKAIRLNFHKQLPLFQLLKTVGFVVPDLVPDSV